MTSLSSDGMSVFAVGACIGINVQNEIRLQLLLVLTGLGPGLVFRFLENILLRGMKGRRILCLSVSKECGRGILRCTVILNNTGKTGRTRRELVDSVARIRV